jgi:Cu/Ag efflux protein CusF
MPAHPGVIAMRTLLIPAAAAAILATSTFAFAAAQHATGTVKAYDSKAMTLTLADGSMYLLPKSFKNPGLKAGEKVSVNWQKSGSKKIADQVTIVK